MKKNDHVFGCVSDYTYQGFGVLKLDHFPVFVKGMLEGECGEVVLTMVKKNFAYGRQLSSVTDSEHRVLPPCAVVKQCGGCQIMHMAKDHQAAFKQKQVEQLMKRVAKIEQSVLPIKTMDHPWGYRNKVMIPIESSVEETKLGFYRMNSHDIIDMDTCLVQTELQNQIGQKLKSFLKDSPIESLRHLVIKQAFATNEVMIGLVSREFPLKHQESLIDMLTVSFPQVQSIYVSINQRDDNVILGDVDKLVFGKETIEDVLLGYHFQISLRSFYQINPVQTEVLYQTVAQFANIQPHETVLDLYCGVGTIGSYLSQFAKKVIGVEVVEEAVVDAKKNAQLNQIENIEFWAMDATGAKEQLHAEKQSIDVIVVDPPRKGLDEQVIADIIELAPQRMIYVSCDPSTLARDIFRLKDHYEVQLIQPVDMFPQTYHVEVVTLLTRNEVSCK